MLSPKNAPPMATPYRPPTSHVAGGDFLVNPCVLALGATGHDARKGCVDADFKGILFQRPLESMGNVEAVINRDDRAWVRREPRNLPTIHRHRESTRAIGVNEDVCGNHRRVL
jgi:hypothetical protein